MRHVCPKGARDGPHKVEKGRHALLVPLLVSVRYRLSDSHGLVKNVIATFYACLFLKFFSLKPCSQVFVSTIFLDLNGDDFLEWANRFSAGWWAIHPRVASFSRCLLLDSTEIELNRGNLFLYDVESFEASSNCIFHGRFSFRRNGRYFGDKIAQMSEELKSIIGLARQMIKHYLRLSKLISCCPSPDDASRTSGVAMISIILSNNHPISADSDSCDDVDCTKG